MPYYNGSVDNFFVAGDHEISDTAYVLLSLFTLYRGNTRKYRYVVNYSSFAKFTLSSLR